jgi:hypothetical protein
LTTRLLWTNKPEKYRSGMTWNVKMYVPSSWRETFWKGTQLLKKQEWLFVHFPKSKALKAHLDETRMQIAIHHEALLILLPFFKNLLECFFWESSQVNNSTRYR